MDGWILKALENVNEFANDRRIIFFCRDCPRTNSPRKKTSLGGNGAAAHGGTAAAAAHGTAAAASAQNPASFLLMTSPQYPQLGPSAAAAAGASGPHHSPLHVACLPPNHPTLPAGHYNSSLRPVSYTNPMHHLATQALIHSPCCGVYTTYHISPATNQCLHYVYQT